jgi:hypothetical protein
VIKAVLHRRGEICAAANTAERPAA